MPLGQLDSALVSQIHLPQGGNIIVKKRILFERLSVTITIIYALRAIGFC